MGFSSLLLSATFAFGYRQRLTVFVARGIDVRDPFAGKFAVFVGVVLNVGVNVVVFAKAVVCRAEVGRADLFEGAGEDVHVFEVLDL